MPSILTLATVSTSLSILGLEQDKDGAFYVRQ